MLAVTLAAPLASLIAGGLVMLAVTLAAPLASLIAGGTLDRPVGRPANIDRHFKMLKVPEKNQCADNQKSKKIFPRREFHYAISRAQCIT